MNCPSQHASKKNVPRKTANAGKLTEGAIPAESLKQEFPSIGLPVRPPYPPMEAKLVPEIPRGKNWLRIYLVFCADSIPRGKH